MTIKTFQVNPLGENCYVINDDTGQAAIIDCGCSTESEWSEIKKHIAKNNLEVVHLLNTHLHFDHVWGNAYAYRDLGLKAEASPLDKSIYENIDNQIKAVAGVFLPHPPIPPLGEKLQEGSNISIGNTILRVLHTPGHSQGSLCFYAEADKTLFSGDTLFQCSYGRTDLEGGSMTQMMSSLRRLASLPDEVKVYPGHGPSTDIHSEKMYNPYLPM